MNPFYFNMTLCYYCHHYLFQNYPSILIRQVKYKSIYFKVLQLFDPPPFCTPFQQTSAGHMREESRLSKLSYGSIMGRRAVVVTLCLLLAMIVTLWLMFRTYLHSYPSAVDRPNSIVLSDSAPVLVPPRLSEAYKYPEDNVDYLVPPVYEPEDEDRDVAAPSSR